MTLISTLLMILSALCSVLIVKCYLIHRRVNHTDWTTLPDSFTLPRSLCTDQDISSSGLLQCISMGGRFIDKCTCECDESRSTFGLFNNQWKCVNASRIRKDTECLYQINSVHHDDAALYTIPGKPAVNVEYYVPMLDIPSCQSYRFSLCEYRKCDSTWTQMSVTFLMKNFYTAKSAGKMVIGMNKNPDPLLQGRLIKLTIDCDASDAVSFCILLKIEGSLNCSFMASTLPKKMFSTSLPSSRPSTLKNTEVFSTSMKRIRNVTPTKQMPPIIRNTIKPSTPADHSDVIAGAVGGSLALIIMIAVVVVLVLLRKKKSKNITENPVIVENKSYDDCIKNSIQHSTDQYSYAYCHAPIRRQPLKEDTQRSVNNQAYGCIEEINPSQTDSSPVYNTLEDPKYTNQISSRFSSPPKEAFYHTLEPKDVPNESQENDGSSIYKALEREKPHMYGTLVRSGVHGDSSEFSANNEEYDSVESMIPR